MNKNVNDSVQIWSQSTKFRLYFPPAFVSYRAWFNLSIDVLEMDLFIGDWLRNKDSCEICGGIVKGEAEGKAKMKKMIL